MPKNKSLPVAALFLFALCAINIAGCMLWGDIEGMREKAGRKNNSGNGDKTTPGLLFMLINDGAAYSVSRGTAADTDIVIPAMYMGLPVTEIGSALFNPDTGGYEGGFAGYTDLASIVIPNSVTYIGEFAFSGCSNLTAIYYEGEDESAWEKITISGGNSFLTDIRRYYYSELNLHTSGTHWHWANGAPELWDTESEDADLNISFMDFNDIGAPGISAGTIYLIGGDERPDMLTITVAEPELYDGGSIEWYINNSRISSGISGNNDETLVFRSADIGVIGIYSITVEVRREGTLYSKVISFEVRP